MNVELAGGLINLGLGFYKKPLKKCKIYYASQTGTAERYSRTLAQKLLKVTNICEESPANLQDYVEEDFTREDAVIVFLVATHYDGLFPDDTGRFVKYIRRLVRNEVRLDNLKYCVFGLGSSDYEYYNEAAKNMQKSLKELGAEEFTPIYLCDELNGVGREFERWLDQLFKGLCRLYNIEYASLNLKSLKEHDYFKSWRYLCDLELRFVNISLESNFEPVPNDIICKQQYQGVEVKVKENVNLIPNADQSVHHIVFDYDGEYSVSDTAYLLYRNPRHICSMSISLYGKYPELLLDLSKEITFVPRYGNVREKVTFSPPFPIPTTIKDSLELYCDLTSLPSDDEIMKFCCFLKDKKDVERITKLVRNEKIMKQIREEVKMTLHEFMMLFFPNVKFNLSGFLQLVPKQKPKPYTISSRPKTGELTVTVKLIEYNLHSLKTFYNVNVKRELFNESIAYNELIKRRIYKGNCSRYLCEMKEGQKIKLFVRTSLFASVNMNAPMLLIANGTGIAAFRGIWHSLKNTCNNTGASSMTSSDKSTSSASSSSNEVTMMLGFRTTNHVLYKEELEQLSQQENVRILYAFSREQDKIYVQELVKNNLELIRGVLDRGGTICICG
ncbi:cytochrome reductase [Theileria orientalis strain Shintoku]|uniref:NADPH--hemoprotein reductase n=1 Tax=Theileria orientalis strain Shintoku TaxID=869250 RepID=J4D9P2_THEOR|nr:cytochrome reductase [Theileria orientalis strain Shintoku]BAM41510.1 cytochrome reductase [Theileria orientalis strain Shintoku]|eukprot:XP_009691811.1 cytochrome reductase [Theileria orientalis strain Shintoku]